MSIERLQEWLELSGKPWPPDHYALLGLKPGDGDIGVIEERGLERMERLRRYQLPFPEEVTEGMNRLAQALDCLGDPLERRRYDISIGIKPSAEAEPEVLPMIEEADLLPEVLPLEYYPAPIVEPLEETYRIEDAEPAAPKRGEPLPEVILLPKKKRRRAEDEDAEPMALPAEDPKREARRERYAELARLRKVLRVWDDVARYLKDPERTFSRRTDSAALIAELNELKPLLPLVGDLICGPNLPGALVASLTRQQLVVDTLRSLVSSQRDALAQDARAAHYRLETRYERVRNEVRDMTRKGFGRKYWNPLMRSFGRNPEWPLLALGVGALVIAFVRSMPG